MIGLELFEKPIHYHVRIRPFGLGNATIAPPDFGDEGIIVAGIAFERGGHTLMRAVKICHVVSPDAPVISILHQGLKSSGALAGLIGTALVAVAAGSHADAGKFQIGLPELNRRVGIVKFWVSIFRSAEFGAQ